MQIKFLGEILENVVGKHGSAIVSILFDKKNVNEFVIAKKLKLTINQTRNILYRLSGAGLVSFIRKKDKRKGWYTYFWTFNPNRALELFETNIKNEIELLKNRLRGRETKRYYICNACKIEVGEETALLHSFTCGECGEVYQLQTDKKIVNEITSKINKLSSNLALIQREIALAREKAEKKKAGKKKKGKARTSRKKRQKQKRRKHGKKKKRR